MADEVHASFGLRRFYYVYYERLQFWLLPLALALNCFRIQMAGWAYLMRMLCHSKQRKSAHWIDLSALVLHEVKENGHEQAEAAHYCNPTSAYNMQRKSKPIPVGRISRSVNGE
jgi:hypothetical protein